MLPSAMATARRTCVALPWAGMSSPFRAMLAQIPSKSGCCQLWGRAKLRPRLRGDSFTGFLAAQNRPPDDRLATCASRAGSRTGHSPLGTSPPARVAMPRSTSASMVSASKVTRPSQNSVLTPPGWLLAAGPEFGLLSENLPWDPETVDQELLGKKYKSNFNRLTVSETVVKLAVVLHIHILTKLGDCGFADERFVRVTCEAQADCLGSGLDLPDVVSGRRGAARAAWDGARDALRTGGAVGRRPGTALCAIARSTAKRRLS